MLADYFARKNLINKACAWEAKQATMLDIAGQHTDNITDSGVYTMRYMEAYMGGSLKDCALKKPADKIIPQLRVKYMHAIVTADHNSVREKVMNWAAGYEKEGKVAKAKKRKA